MDALKTGTIRIDPAACVSAASCVRYGLDAEGKAVIAEHGRKQSHATARQESRQERTLAATDGA